ncbi:hypothetical protein SAMN04487857_1119 [Pseudomonas sp. ok272]|uniref:hypothetical protein n=1 Tax=unclassified Pseudomonas TaxID=196821 RepID=UPI0008B48AF8|nr:MULTISPECIES: hypothetical protein [unclassified Pseudomonas]SEN16616.1 hypothetical protein SAMN04487857_1119 [Pseudomonas sp. ok272]SFN08760.1 hypothetical protein SAMN04487858_1129 [Pseudomonas sp. ok602]
MSTPSPTPPRLAAAVSQQFAQRTRLDSVIIQLLGAAIAERYPNLVIDLNRTHLARPQHPGRGWKLIPLLQVVRDYLSSGSPLDFSDVDDVEYYLSDAPPKRLKLPGLTRDKLDMKVIEGLIKELSRTLAIGLQDALVRDWNADAGNGISRWQWLSNLLADTLRISGLRQPGLDTKARTTLDQLVTTPDRDQRQARHGQDAVFAYGLETTLNNATQTVTLLGTELLLTRSINGNAPVLLCHPNGHVEVFASMDAFTQTWGERLSAQYTAQSIVTHRCELDGNVFHQQAAMILNQQLEHLQALQLPLKLDAATLDRLHLELTDPGPLLVGPQLAHPRELDLLRPHLAPWLLQASPADRATYRQYSLALASAKVRGAGRTFLSDIPDIQAYSLDALQRELNRDAASLGTPAPHPDDLQLTFTVAAGYPGTVGIIKHVSMSLSELAIHSLVARPSGQLRVTHRQGGVLPDWLTPDYITRSGGLIERVDIGQHYPDMLSEQLLGDTPEVREREVLFADQQAAQLPLLALELHLKQEAGLSRAGAQRVADLMHTDASHPDTVIRRLLVLRSPDATPDVVSDMYIIEAIDPRSGPHLLYRPLYPQPLLEYPSRWELLQAIAQPGELQDSVLTWMSDSARPIYANGGFQQPHYVRFGLGDEFSVPRVPEPARLGIDSDDDELHQWLMTGRLMQYLFSKNAQALVDQAKHESVSTRESRWRVLLEGGGLLFNNLLPLLRGPAMLTGWLLSLIGSLANDIQSLAGPDPVSQEQGTVDLLLNLGLLLLDVPAVTLDKPPLAPELKHQALRAPVPRRIAQQWPEPPPPVIREGMVTLPGEWLPTAKPLLDFSFAQANDRLTVRQRMQLARFKLALTHPLPPPVLNGPRQGLYIFDNQWHALVDGDVFKVVLEPDARVVIVDPADARLRGPYLRPHGNGRWSVDTRLRLRGGMPPGRIAAERQRKAQRIQQLNAQYKQFLEQQAGALSTTNKRLIDLQASESDPTLNERQRAELRRLAEQALREQTDSFKQLLDSLKEREELGIGLSQSVVTSLLTSSITNARTLVVIAENDRQALYDAQPRFTPRNPRFTLDVLADPTGHRQFIDQLLEINERSIAWLELKDRYLDELYGLGSAGREQYLKMTRDRPAELSALGVKELQIHTLKLRAFDELTGQSLETQEALHHLFLPLHEHVRTHAELNALELAADERLSVLESLVEHYGRTLDGLKGLGMVNADELHTDYFGRLLTLIEALYQDVTTQLASEIKPLAQPRVHPPRRSPVAVGRPQKRVIRTERKGTLIGELRPASADLPIDVVEVRSEETNQVLGTYAQRGGEWNEFRTVRAPGPAPAPRAVSPLKGQARKLLAKLEQHLLRGDEYKKVCRHPQEVQEILDLESTRYDKLATELDRAIQAMPESARVQADQTLLDNLRSGAVRLTEKGKALRIQLCLELAPTHGNLAYLISERRANMALLGERIRLSGERKDFVQEYAINDEKGYPLWYAHFHYPSANTSKLDYTVAHLKTREQRRVSYYTLLNGAQGSQAIVNVHRGLIGRPLAERWFLPLAP